MRQITPRCAGRFGCRLLVLNFFLFVVLGLDVSFAQERDESHGLQLDGWQGTRPAPQQAPLPSSPQRYAPLQPQVLELPPTRQPSVQALPQQQTIPSARQQPSSKRPKQLLTITVTDRNGQYISGLRAEDFVLYEGDLSQPITYFNTGQQEPVSLGFLVDMSESMHGKRRRAVQALRKFVLAIKPRDEVFLVGFNHKLQLLQDFTDSRTLLTQATAGLQTAGNTALYDALLDGLRRVQTGRRQKKALILISDGMDTASQASREEAFRAARKANILIYTIGLGDLSQRTRRPSRPMGGPMGGSMWGSMMGPMGGSMGGPFMPSRGRPNLGAVDVRLLQTLSDMTGARHFFLSTKDVISSQDVLEYATQTIAHELRQQYSIGYLSPLKGDVYRDVRIETRRRGLIIRTHKGTG